MKEHSLSNEKRTGAFLSLSPFTPAESSSCGHRNELRGRGFAAQCNFFQFQQTLQPPSREIPSDSRAPAPASRADDLQKFPLLRDRIALFFPRRIWSIEREKARHYRVDVDRIAI